MEKPTIEIYTDGSCRGNPGPGGWAALILNSVTGDEIIVKGGDKATTNNKMELTAIIEALNAIPNEYSNKKVKIYSDSSYCVKGISEWMPGWIKTNFKGKKNVELWKTYLNEAERFDITVEWVQAHNGHPENELVDSIAFKEASKYV